MNFDKLTLLAGEEVSDTLRQLPARLSLRSGEVPVFLEKAPDAEDIASGIECDTLGLYDEGEADIPTPRIRLWLVNIWDYSGQDEITFREETRITLLHELGHALGWEEEDLEERGLD